MTQHTLSAISPIDGRYRDEVKSLAPFLSEAALMRYRVYVEVEYLIALRKLPPADQTVLRHLHQHFSERDAEQVKIIELETKHDVKAIEYFIKRKLSHTKLKKQLEFVHFGLTSEDINNLAYSLMLRDALQQVYMPALQQLVKIL